VFAQSSASHLPKTQTYYCNTPANLLNRTVLAHTRSLFSCRWKLFQNFFMHNLSSLTDFSKKNKEIEVVDFLNDLVFASLCKN
jgi:hypothetical protein